MPFLTATAYSSDGCRARIQFEARSDDGETHLININKNAIVASTDCGIVWVAHRELWIVGSEAAWPAGGYSQRALGEAGLTSNVTHAVGFFGGVLTKVLPYEDCTFQSDGAPVPDYCLLRYNQETATVSGTVTEPRCVGPLDSVVVRLTEQNRDPARIRTALTNGVGEFLIGALEPGIPHFLWVRAPRVPIDSMWDTNLWSWVYTDWEDIHTLHTDTLTFLPGQRVAYAISLERLVACDEEHLPQ